MVWNIAFYKRGGFDRGDGDTFMLIFFFISSYYFDPCDLYFFPVLPLFVSVHVYLILMQREKRFRCRIAYVIIPIVQLKINVSMVIALAALGYPCMWGWI